MTRARPTPTTDVPPDPAGADPAALDALAAAAWHLAGRHFPLTVCIAALVGHTGRGRATAGAVLLDRPAVPVADPPADPLAAVMTAGRRVAAGPGRFLSLTFSHAHPSGAPPVMLPILPADGG